MECDLLNYAVWNITKFNIYQCFSCLITYHFVIESIALKFFRYAVHIIIYLWATHSCQSFQVLSHRHHFFTFSVDKSKKKFLLSEIVMLLHVHLTKKSQLRVRCSFLPWILSSLGAGIENVRKSHESIHPHNLAVMAHNPVYLSIKSPTLLSW